MGSVRVSTSTPATKGSAEFDYNNLNEPKELRLMIDVSDGNRIELADAVKRQHEQPKGPVIQWDRFLPLRSLKVLLVEDDDSTRHVVSALLRNCSYEVTAVANGLEAWKVLIDLNKHIDLVLTEVVMPRLSGIGLLSKIMNLVPRKNIPVSSGSESESGVGAPKPTKARSTGIESDEDGDGAKDGSGTQSSWSNRVVEVESTKYSWDQLAGPPDSTRALVVHAGEDNKLDAIAMGKDLETGAPRNPEKCSESNLKETSEPRAKSTNKVMIGKTNESLYSKCSPALELSLKRPLAVEVTNASTHKRIVLKHSDLSAFSRYTNTTSNTNQASTMNVGSCSPLAVTISSEATNPMNIQSNCKGALNQRSNGSARTLNNDMGSSTNNALDGKRNSPYLCEHDKPAQFQVHHHHQHNKIQQQQEMANRDDGSSRKMMSNGSTASAETNYDSATGSNSKTNGENGITEKGKFGNSSGSVVDQDRLAQREAALNKFRQKRKERCFEKKVLYQSRKKLAEQRPRVRGQFVRQDGVCI